MSGQAKFYPQHVDLPKENPADEARRMALNLTAAIQKLQGLASRKQGRHVEALKRLSAIFGNETDLMAPEEHLPRQSSSNPTAPAQLRSTPRVHAR